MRIPASTYRLQFNAAFTFRDAADVIPYLHALGVTDVYASSYLKPVTGSPHGYDVADPTRLNPELGSDDDFRAFVRALTDCRMGQVLDIVPNHMGIARTENPWWIDVLENGALAYVVLRHRLASSNASSMARCSCRSSTRMAPCSKRSRFSFAMTTAFHRRVLREPFAGRTAIVGARARAPDRHARRSLGADDPRFQDLQSLIGALHRLPATSDCSAEAVAAARAKRAAAGCARWPPSIPPSRRSSMRTSATSTTPGRSAELIGLTRCSASRSTGWRSGVSHRRINYRRLRH
jgi:(1->4)-alpha-D-glucan 1-alpha-D-glucosylmutase